MALTKVLIAVKTYPALSEKYDHINSHTYSQRKIT